MALYQHFDKNIVSYDHYTNSFYIYNSLNINISTKKSFVLQSLRKNPFLAIYRLISTFQRKVRYFEITLKTHYFVNTMIKSFFGHNSLNINITARWSLFWDHFENIDFCPFIRKYQHFKKNNISTYRIIFVISKKQ